MHNTEHLLLLYKNKMLEKLLNSVTREVKIGIFREHNLPEALIYKRAGRDYSIVGNKVVWNKEQ